jgi:hypothetical protein
MASSDLREKAGRVYVLGESKTVSADVERGRRGSDGVATDLLGIINL